MSNNRMSPSYFENIARNAFNKSQGTEAKKSIVSIRRSQHEFDLYQEEVIVGGISTSPWINRTAKRTSNSGGQDRVAAELLLMFGVIDSFSTQLILLQLPIAVNEITLAIWLITKGFSPSAIASLSAKTDTDKV